MGRERFSPEKRDVSGKVFDAIFVLGAGIITKRGRFEPGFDGKMRTIAACQTIISGLTDNIVFVGGKVYGEIIPSEAEVMRSYAMRFIPTVANNIKVSEQSKDSSTNPWGY